MVNIYVNPNLKLCIIAILIALISVSYSCSDVENTDNCVSSILGEWQFVYISNSCEGEVDFINNCKPQETNENCGRIIFTQVDYVWEFKVDGDYDSEEYEYQITDKLLLMCCGDDGVWNYTLDCDKLILEREEDDGECQIYWEVKKI